MLHDALYCVLRFKSIINKRSNEQIMLNNGVFDYILLKIFSKLNKVCGKIPVVVKQLCK